MFLSGISINDYMQNARVIEPIVPVTGNLMFINILALQIDL